MPVYANINVTASTDGLPYTSPALAIPATAADNDLFNQPSPVQGPVPVRANQAVVALVQLTIAGGPATNNAYVVLQTDMGDGNWMDVAWIVTAVVTNGVLNFELSGGVAGSNALALTRAAGTAPGSNGSNQIPLGGRIRFVGRAQLTGGTAPSVTALIKYKFLPLK
jgi:hypothetical protein